VKRSAKTSQAEGLPRHRLRKRNDAPRRKPRQRRKQRRSVCSAVYNVLAFLMGLCRLRKQMQRRRRLLLPTLRRRHAALRDPRVPELRLRNNAPCQSSCRFTWLSLHLCRAHSLVVTVTDSSVAFVLIALCVHDITRDYVCDVRCLSSHSMATSLKITE
jgi:hypothetical protein